jgi:hypothetical protein
MRISTIPSLCAHFTYLQFVLSLRFPSASSSLTFREGVRELPRELVLLVESEAVLDLAFFETVLPLSRACLRKSCILAAVYREKIVEKSVWEGKGSL